MRVFGIMLLGKAVAITVFPSAAKVRPTGSQIVIVFSAEKSPDRIGIEATLYTLVGRVTCRNRSKLEAKNSLSFPLKTFGTRIGPAIVKPY